MRKMPSLIQVTPNCIREGLYLHYKGRIYRIVDQNGLQTRVVSEVEPNSQPKYVKILGILKNDSGYVFAGSFAEIDIKLKSTRNEGSPAVENDIPKKFLMKAHVIISLVEGFNHYLESAYQHSDAKMSKREILDEYLAQSLICQSRSTYYKYKKLYDIGEANPYSIANKLRRKPRQRLQNS